MDKTPAPEPGAQPSEAPTPETLVARADDGTPEGGAVATAVKASQATSKRRRRTYRPSHKATFIGLAAVIAILVINVVILSFVLKGKSKNNSESDEQVTISKAALSKVGVNQSSLGDSGVVLTIGPNTQFNNKITVQGDVNIGGQLKLNSKFTASDATLTSLQAGKVSFSELNVSGDGTLNNLNLRNGLVVTGSTQLQGPVTINQLLTLNNSLLVVGNLSVGGTFAAKTFSATNLASTGTLSIGGHLITGGSSPSVAKGGGALGSNGTVSISGNDTAGRIAVNVGVGASSGLIATVTFKTAFSSTPHVFISPVGVACTFYISSLSTTGFSVSDGCNLPNGGFAVDYLVVQ